MFRDDEINEAYNDDTEAEKIGKKKARKSLHPSDLIGKGYRIQGLQKLSMPRSWKRKDHVVNSVAVEYVYGPIELLNEYPELLTEYTSLFSKVKRPPWFEDVKKIKLMLHIRYGDFLRVRTHRTSHRSRLADESCTRKAFRSLLLMWLIWVKGLDASANIRKDLERMRNTDDRKWEDDAVEKWSKASNDPSAWWAAESHKRGRIRIYYDAHNERWRVSLNTNFIPRDLFEECAAMRSPYLVAEVSDRSWDHDFIDLDDDLESWDSTDEKSWRVIDALLNSEVHRKLVLPMVGGGDEPVPMVLPMEWPTFEDLINLFPANVIKILKDKDLQQFLEGKPRKASKNPRKK